MRLNWRKMGSGAFEAETELFFFGIRPTMKEDLDYIENGSRAYIHSKREGYDRLFKTFPTVEAAMDACEEIAGPLEKWD